MKTNSWRLALAVAGSFAVSSLISAEAGPVCASEDIQVFADYASGKADDCTVKGNTIKVVIQPEAENVNPSPWYSFRIESSRPQRVRIVLDYGAYGHRFEPKLSADGENWFPMTGAEIKAQKKKRFAKFRVRVPQGSVYFSAQEIISYDDHRAWAEEFASAHGATLSVIGASVEGKEIFKLETRPASGKAAGAAIFVGRQHPPEITGAIAFQTFMDEVFADTDLSRRFRDRFAVIAVPILNPDGVDAGHWRLNAGGVDLNRDWGPFTQPETQAMRDVLTETNDEFGIALFLDFHSTFKNVLYTQTDDVETRPKKFAERWHSAIKTRHPGFGLVREGGHNTDRPTSKAYVFGTYGAAAITYEMYDEASREDIRAVARTAAQEMMTIMLDDDETQSSVR